MSKEKLIGFHFYKTMTLDDDKPATLGLKGLFDRILKDYEDAKASIKEGNKEKEEFRHIFIHNDEPARLLDIWLDSQLGYYHLTFERLAYAAPSQSSLHKAPKAVKLEDDEYIGNEVSVLYDPENRVLMLQRNRASLSPAGIEKCLATLVEKFKVSNYFDLSVVIDPDARTRALKQKSYRKIQLRIFGEKAKGLAEKAFGIRPKGVDTVEIRLSSGGKKKDEIDMDITQKILKEYKDDHEVKTLKVRAREEELERVQEIDLIDHKVQEFITMPLNKDRQIAASDIYESMVSIYGSEETGLRGKIKRM